MKLRQQLLVENDCYRQGKPMKPVGIMVHSTGAANPRVARYVPGNGELGINTMGNHWNQSNQAWKAKYGSTLNKCVHAFVGQFADGSVGAVQTLPWTMAGWHAGGSANSGYIGFEICEDGLEDETYFRAVYREAVELTAYLCGQFQLDPHSDGVVLCHAEGHARGIASNHGDVLHWFSRFGATMEGFRADVAQRLEKEEEAMEFAQLRKQWQDNDHSAWSETAIGWAVEHGLIAGREETDGTINYMWEDVLTREQLVVILYQFARYLDRV